MRRFLGEDQSSNSEKTGAIAITTVEKIATENRQHAELAQEYRKKGILFIIVGGVINAPLFYAIFMNPFIPRERMAGGNLAWLAPALNETAVNASECLVSTLCPTEVNESRFDFTSSCPVALNFSTVYAICNW